VLKFIVFKNGQPDKEFQPQACYLIGPDEVPVRGEITCADGVITCRTSITEAVALALMWEVPRCGKYLLQTTRLGERKHPYILNVELARWRMMRLIQKLEDWSLFDCPQMDQIDRQIKTARNRFISAIQTLDQPAKAADLADQSLELSMEAGEATAKFYAMRMLGPRLRMKGVSKKLFGSRIDPDMDIERLTPDILSALNFVQIPVRWSRIQPGKDQFNFAKLDHWFDFLLKRRVTIKLTSLLRFHEAYLPKWLKESKVDFEAIRDLAFEFLSRIANRYGKYARSWTVLSGIHGENYFSLNFDQILELTRLSCLRAKQLCPRATTVIEILWPWGEYYASNPRSIHPFLYADLVTQSGINFDGLALKLLFGAPQEGFQARDILQISAMIDRYVMLGKPLHLVTSVPSQTVSGASNGNNAGGYWTGPWTTRIQAQWLETFCHIALSRPQVESITWNSLVDENSLESIPDSGLLTKDLTGKAAFSKMIDLRGRLARARTEVETELPSQ